MADEKLGLTVSVRDEYVDALDDVVERLGSAGMEVEEVLPALGAVTGSVQASQLTALSDVEGVSDVEPARTIQLPPPDSPIQ
ncbi:MAG TPA: hypothetical protein VGV40_02525 [Solirubrobacteraceae bacterium]|nr:hypothetical protein [Solirubrobacteraceae bacterium]